MARFDLYRIARTAEKSDLPLNILDPTHDNDLNSEHDCLQYEHDDHSDTPCKRASGTIAIQLGTVMTYGDPGLACH
jgi:hypothetical protein